MTNLSTPEYVNYKLFNIIVNFLNVHTYKKNTNPNCNKKPIGMDSSVFIYNNIGQKTQKQKQKLVLQENTVTNKKLGQSKLVSDIFRTVYINSEIVSENNYW